MEMVTQRIRRRARHGTKSTDFEHVAENRLLASERTCGLVIVSGSLEGLDRKYRGRANKPFEQRRSNLLMRGLGDFRAVP